METIIAIWETYKNDIVPALVTGLLLIVSALFVFVAKKIRARGYEAEAEAKIAAENASSLTALEESRDIKIDAISQELRATRDCLFYLAELFNTAFQTSTLPPEVKETLNNITARVKNGMNEDVVVSLENEISKYKELYEEAKLKIEETVEKISDVTESSISRIRR